MDQGLADASDQYGHAQGIDLRAGELVLLPHNDAHVFGSDLSAEPMPAHEVMQPRAGEISSSGAWIESSFRFAASEMAAGRMGSTTVIAKLSELLFVEAVSKYVASLPAERRGWLAGLRDPQIGRALALLHSREGRGSVAQVAFAVGYESEAAFSRAFKRQFGTSPGSWRRHSER